MMRRSGIFFFAALFIMGSLFTSCSDDEKTTEEVVEPTTDSTPAEPPVEEPEPVSQDPIGDVSSFPNVYFAFDDYTLSGDAQDTLNKVHEYLSNTSNAVVQVEGHCDERGSIEYNLALGERRAQAVKNYLVQLGVDASRLPTISYGEERPSLEGHDESAWAQNRRSQFVISNQ